MIPKKSDWQSSKTRHLALADNSASSYDKNYGKDNFATNFFMRYELATLKKVVSAIPTHNIALDLGCGTGRYSFVLAKHFRQVYAYDFSPEMIKIAKAKKSAQAINNVEFEVRDIEAEILPQAASSVALITAGFGMGSFVQFPEQTLFRELRRILEPSGLAIISFYNSPTFKYKGQNSALVANVLNDSTLSVTFNTEDYQIPVRTYKPTDIEVMIKGSNLKLHKLLTYPTLSPYLLPTLLTNQIVRELYYRLEALLARRSNVGTYILAICQNQ